MLFASGAAAQQQYAYPAKGQSQGGQQASYGNVRAACLQGRGYTVK